MTGFAEHFKTGDAKGLTAALESSISEMIFSSEEAKERADDLLRTKYPFLEEFLDDAFDVIQAKMPDSERGSDVVLGLQIAVISILKYAEAQDLAVLFSPEPEA